METIPKNDCIFASCDDKYFKKHGPVFINSCLSNENNCHVHVINPENDTLEVLEQFHENCANSIIPGYFTYSTERIDTSQFFNFEEERSYYASNRFLTVSRFLNIFPGVRYMVLDIDCIVRCNLDMEFPNVPAGYFPREYEKNPSMKVAAGILYVGYGGQPFINNVSQNIQHIYRKYGKWIWFNDQIAISDAVNQTKLHYVHFKQEDMAWDFGYYPNATIFTGKGDRKNSSVLYLNERRKYE